MSRTVIITIWILSALFAAVPAKALFGGGKRPDRKKKFPTGVPVEPLEVKPSGLEGSPPQGWENIGPGGGGTITFPRFAPSDPNTAVVTCDMGGVYLTTDGGNTWKMFNNIELSSIAAFHPRAPGIFLVGETSAVQKTTDGGKTFIPEPSQVRRQSPDCAGHVVYFDPDFPDELTWCSMGHWLRDHGRGGIEYSTNAGSNFTPAKGACEGTFTWSISADPATPKSARRVLAGSERGVLVSDDAGKTWKKLESWKYGPCYTVAVLCPLSRDKATYFASSGQGYFRSDDRGGSWVKLDVPHKNRCPEIACSPFDDKYVYCNGGGGVYVSSDGGKTFSCPTNSLRRKGWRESTPGFAHWANRVPSQGGHVGGLGMCWGDPKTVMTSGDMCAAISHDAGENWDAVYTLPLDDGKEFSGYGLEVTTCYGAVFKPDDPKWIFLCYTDMGLFRSEDYGRGWNHGLAPTAPNERDGKGTMWNSVYKLIFDPVKTNEVWICQSCKHDLPYKFEGKGDAYYGGVVSKSTNAGRSWAASFDGLPNAPFTDIVLDPDSPPGKRRLWVAALADGVYRSDDDGAHWEKKSQGLPGDARVWRLWLGPREKRGKKKARSLYVTVCRDNGTGLYSSGDGGDSWERVAQFGRPYDIVVDEDNPNRLYLTNEGSGGAGFNVSEDGGKTWKCTQPAARSRGITVSPFDHNVVFFCAGQVYVSEDRGVSFRTLPGIPRYYNSTRVTVDQVDPNAIWVGTYGRGYFRGSWKEGVTVEPIKGRPSGVSVAAYHSQAAAESTSAPISLDFGRPGKLPEPDTDKAEALKGKLKKALIAGMEDGFSKTVNIPVFGRLLPVRISTADEDIIEAETDGDIVEIEWDEIDSDTFDRLVDVVLAEASPETMAAAAEYYARSRRSEKFWEIYRRAEKLSDEHKKALDALLEGGDKKSEGNGKTTEENAE